MKKNEKQKITLEKHKKCDRKIVERGKMYNINT
jgi:hypothetical protein